jgi:tetratricopeptide (TPR) repeat protein
MQSELAQTIVEQLRERLGGTVSASAKAQIREQVQAAVKGGTKNAESHQLYLQGLFYLHQFSWDNVVKAQRDLERAQSSWTRPSRLHGRPCRGWARSAGEAPRRTREFEDGFALARRAADRAVALEPELPSAHLARMRVQMWKDFDWKGAAQSLRGAQRGAPADADVVNAAAELAYAFGQKEIALDLAQKAVSLDPLNPEPRSVLRKRPG